MFWGRLTRRVWGRLVYCIVVNPLCKEEEFGGTLHLAVKNRPE